MTEQEAKTKECCGPVGAGTPVYAEKHYEQHPSMDMSDMRAAREMRNALVRAQPPVLLGRTCSGSACMAWRLHAGVGPTGVPNVATTDGYCGLAGKA